MSDYPEEDEELREAFDEFQKTQEKEEKPSAQNIIKSLPSKFWIGLAGVVFFLAYLTFIRETMEQSTFFWFIIGTLVLVLILSTQSQAEQKKLIPETQLKAILYVKLKEKQRISPTEVAMGEISVLLPCKMKKVEGTPTKYVMSFKITTTSGLERYYTAEMDPFTGYLLGFEERPAGFRGVEVSDIKFIRHREDVWEDRYGKKK